MKADQPILLIPGSRYGTTFSFSLVNKGKNDVLCEGVYLIYTQFIQCPFCKNGRCDARSSAEALVVPWNYEILLGRTQKKYPLVPLTADSNVGKWKLGRGESEHFGITLVAAPGYAHFVEIFVDALDLSSGRRISVSGSKSVFFEIRGQGNHCSGERTLSEWAQTYPPVRIEDSSQFNPNPALYKLLIAPSNQLSDFISKFSLANINTVITEIQSLDRRHPKIIQKADLILRLAREQDKSNDKGVFVNTILFLAADPTNDSRLRLGEEFREIDEQLTLAKLRERFNLALPQFSLRAKDIARTLLNTQPQIVHFSGHGTPKGALCFENEVGERHDVQPDALAALFEQFADQVNCVVLNACYSDVQAKAIAEHINYVIGMNKAIGDKAAIAFALGFYGALGAGRTIEDAYKLGCVQIRLQGIPEHLTPVLIKKGQA